MEKTTMKVRKVANLIMVYTESFPNECDVIWKVWGEHEFTEKKLSNYMRKMEKQIITVNFDIDLQ